MTKAKARDFPARMAGLNAFAKPRLVHPKPHTLGQKLDAQERAVNSRSIKGDPKRADARLRAF